MEDIRCVFCEKESDQVVIKENGYMGRKCSQCDLIYISPRPSFNEIRSLYQNDNANISAASHTSAAFSTRLHARHSLKIVTSFIKSGAILEIGAGAGYFLDEARKLGFEPYAIEFNPIQAKFIKDQLIIPCEESPLTASLFEGKKFDVVYHCDVISHFFDPISEFKKMNERMKEGSILVFETGNLGDVNQRYFKYFSRFQYPDHLFFFSADNLAEILDRADFELVKIYRYSILPELMLVKTAKRLINISHKSTKKRDVLTTGVERALHPCDRTSGEGTPSLAISQPVYRSQNASKMVKIARITWTYIKYLVRYKIGYMAPKTCKPQTVIVVARKRAGTI